MVGAFPASVSVPPPSVSTSLDLRSRCTTPPAAEGARRVVVHLSSKRARSVSWSGCWGATAAAGLRSGDPTRGREARAAEPARRSCSQGCALRPPAPRGTSRAYPATLRRHTGPHDPIQDRTGLFVPNVALSRKHSATRRQRPFHQGEPTCVLEAVALNHISLPRASRCGPSPPSDRSTTHLQGSISSPLHLRTLSREKHLSGRPRGPQPVLLGCRMLPVTDRRANDLRDGRGTLGPHLACPEAVWSGFRV
jgi:hypothetical protein